MTKKAKTWEQMTRTERRVAICEDVIAQINLGDMNIMDNTSYLRGPMPKSLKRSATNINLSKKQARDIQKGCDMCARGALMISKIARFNNVTLANLTLYDDDFISVKQRDTTIVLEEAFCDEELSSIEDAFEVNSLRFYASKECRQFRRDHESPSERFIAICQNIIDHGEFKPEVRYDIVEYVIK